jgi:hypothetical protein
MYVQFASSCQDGKFAGAEVSLFSSAETDIMANGAAMAMSSIARKLVAIIFFVFSKRFSPKIDEPNGFLRESFPKT